jgi:hypothetical protein
MHFVFNLLRIKDLYMFRALLAHPQEALNKRHFIYCVRVMSVGCCGCGANEAFILMDLERCNIVVVKELSSESSVAIYTAASQNV